MDLDNYLLLAFILAPFFFGIMLTRTKGERTLWYLSTAASMLFFGVSIYLLFIGVGTEIYAPLFTHYQIGFKTSGFSLVYGVITCGLWLVSVISSREYFFSNQKNLGRYYGSLFITLTGCLGVFYAYDLVTLFIFFEIMSMASYFWVVHVQTKEAVRASNIYLAYSVIGGLCILLGIFALSANNLNLELDNLNRLFSESLDGASFACFFLFIGFGIKVGAFFLHDWQPQAYTEAPAPASGLMSSILTKCGVYGLLIVVIKILPTDRAFSRDLLLISLLTMLIGAICAFLSGNLKRVLAFSSMSQLGFIMWGCAFSNLLEEHNTFAAYGTMFHMINHSFIKILLFTLAGIVYQNTQTLNLSEIKGFGRNKPWFQGLFLISTLSLGGIPLFSGYISKTLLHESIVEYMHDFPTPASYIVYEYLFLLTGGFTIAYCCKLYCCLFLEKSESKWSKTSYASKLNLVSLTVVAFILLILGVTANIIFSEIGVYTAELFQAHPVENIAYFSWANLKGAVTSIILAALITYGSRSFVQKEDYYKEHIQEGDSLLEKFYLPLIEAISLIFALITRTFDVLLDFVVIHSTRKSFNFLKIPETFYFGEEHLEKKKAFQIKITQSLAYSLLMFGFGFIFTIVYLLVVGGSL